MNLILLFPEDFVDPSRVRLKDYRAAHLREILRAQIDQTFKVGLVNNGMGEGKVLSLEKDSVALEVKIREKPALPPDISLIVALPRPQTLKKVLEAVGAIGVRRLMFIDAVRVEKSFFQSKLLKDNRWLMHLRLGMEQGGKTYLPDVSFHPSFPQFVEEMKNLAGTDSTRLIAAPEARQTLWETPLAQIHSRHEILCAVGPEGGWLPEETGWFAENGFQPVRLGSSLLRVENAVCAFLAEIEFLQMRFLKER